MPYVWCSEQDRLAVRPDVSEALRRLESVYYPDNGLRDEVDRLIRLPLLREAASGTNVVGWPEKKSEGPAIPWESRHEPPRFSSNRMPSFDGCAYCRSSGQQRDFYMSHSIRQGLDGPVTCPVLRNYTCPVCGNRGGDNAHTIRYCPMNHGQVVSAASVYRTPRMSNGRQRVSVAAQNTRPERKDFGAAGRGRGAGFRR